MEKQREIESGACAGNGTMKTGNSCRDASRGRLGNASRQGAATGKDEVVDRKRTGRVSEVIWLEMTLVRGIWNGHYG